MCSKRLLRLFTHARNLILKFLMWFRHAFHCTRYFVTQSRHLSRAGDWRVQDGSCIWHSKQTFRRPPELPDPYLLVAPTEPLGGSAPHGFEKVEGLGLALTYSITQLIKSLTNDLTFSFRQMARTFSLSFSWLSTAAGLSSFIGPTALTAHAGGPGHFIYIYIYNWS